MAYFKKIENDKLYLYLNGKLVYKKWLNTGVSKVFDAAAYDKYTITSIRELDYVPAKDLIVLTAKLKMKTTEEGGRKTGFISGYRPNHVFEYENNKIVNTFIGDIVFQDQDTIEPGEEKIVTVRFLLDLPIEKYLNIGRKWLIHEGERAIGEAEILRFGN